MTRTFLMQPKKSFAVFIVLAVLLAAVPVYAAPAANIDIAVKAGYDDTARVGATVPFRVALVNKGNDFTGEVQVVISLNPGAKAAYAAPCSLPRGVSKEVVINVPVYTANKKVEVRLVKGGKAVKSGNYEFKKLIPPETPVIGVLSDDINSFKDLKGMKITQNTDLNTDIGMKKRAMAAAGVASEALVLPDVPVELIQLDASSMPDDIKGMNGFNYLIISNFDTSSLSEKQIKALETWIESGRIIFIGTGPNWKKVYSGLPDSLKPFSINGAKTIPVPKTLETFTGKANPQGNLNIATGSTGNGQEIIDPKGTPLSVAYKKNNGCITVLTFDPSLSPVSDWSEVQTLWKNLILSVTKDTGEKIMAQATPYPIPGRPYMDLQYLASNVPETQSPPFTLLLVLVGVYILITGPSIYLFLKWRDKRDLSWLVIPAFAFIFMGIIYLAGYKTRYTTAVLNNVSLITLNSQSKSADITTWMGAFNNGRGDMKIEYDKNLSLEVSNNFYYDRYMGGYPAQDDRNARILSKYNLSDPPSYELYDVRLWEPRFAVTSKTKPMDGFSIDSVAINNGKFDAVIKNNSGYDLKEALIVVGNNFIDLDELPAGKEKNVSVDLNGPSVKKRFDEFLDARYGQPYYGNPGQKMPPDWPEKSRKRNLFENVLRNMIMNTQGKPQILFFALNNDDQGYSVVINGKEPKKYSTNIVYSAAPMNFEKGKQVIIPSGIFKPVLEDQKNAHFEDPLMGGVRVHGDGDVDFKVVLPDNINPGKIKIDWSTFLPSYAKYRPKAPKGVQQPPLAKNTYKYYIYNIKASKWEEVGQQYILESNLANYINDKHEVKLRANAVLDKNGMQDELLGLPELEISGVVK